MPATSRTVVLVALLLGAAAVRIMSFDSSSLIAERQFRSALIARAIYYETVDSVAPWRLEVARLNREREGRLEPPILEHVVAAVYRVTGGERLGVARALTTLAWLLGGVAFYLLASRMLPTTGALAATTYFLFNPLGVHASISFLPDPIMMSLLVLALLCIVEHDARPSGTTLALAAAAAASAILIKPVCVFALLGAHLALALRRRDRPIKERGRTVLLFVTGALLPAALYYGYGILVEPLVRSGGMDRDAFLSKQATTSFVPYLLVEPEFWRGWLGTVTRAAGRIPLVAGLVGLALMRAGQGRALMLGITAGYLVFCVAFSYFTPFARHYHLQILVVIAVGIGQLTAVLVEKLRIARRHPLWWAVPAVAIVAVAVFTMRGIRYELRPRPMEPRELAQAVGDITNHSVRTVHVATFYGKPLQYHGELFGVFWPRAAPPWQTRDRSGPPLGVEARLDTLPIDPEYFIITDLSEYRRHHADLAAYLARNCASVAATEAYLIYGNCRRRASGTL